MIELTKEAVETARQAIAWGGPVFSVTNLAFALDAFAAQRVAEASAWRPIETAPKDGTEIDLFMPNGPRIPDCWWAFDNRWVRRARGHAMVEQVNGWPSHWRPLPSPPGSEP